MLGRPDQATVVFGRRVTRRKPGRFHTKVFNSGTKAAVQIHYRGFIQRIPHTNATS